jgi:translation elongation factor P/translation initiation factor 5A
MRTKTLLIVTIGALAARVGSADETTPMAKVGQLMTASAKVDKVDMKKRELTLKSEDGKPFTISVPENVTRLENVKQGDMVHISFYESVAVSLTPPGVTPMPGERTQTTTQKASGQLPGGTTVQQVTTMAKVTKLDQANNEMTIETPAGKSNTIKVDDPQLQTAMNKLKVGDRIKATYTEAMATSVTAPQHM